MPFQFIVAIISIIFIWGGVYVIGAETSPETAAGVLGVIIGLLLMICFKK